MNMHISHGWREKIGNTKHKNLHVARIHLPVSPREARETIYILKIFIAVLSNHVGIFFFSFSSIFVRQFVGISQTNFICMWKNPAIGIFSRREFFPQIFCCKDTEKFSSVFLFAGHFAIRMNHAYVGRSFAVRCPSRQYKFKYNANVNKSLLLSVCFVSIYLFYLPFEFLFHKETLEINIFSQMFCILHGKRH